MKKIGLMVMAVALSLSVAAFAGQDQPKAERPAPKSKTEQPKTQKIAPKGKTVRGTEAQSSQALADQIAQVKQQHQAELNELQEIRKLANEEKATKTLGALDKLIARRHLEFQQRLQKLETQGTSGDEPKTEGGKSKPKGKNKGTPNG